MKVKISEAFLLIRNGASIKQSEHATGIPITRIETISNRYVDRNRLGYANIMDTETYKSYILHDKDILMSHINSEKHLGKSALYAKRVDENIIHGMNLLVLRANDRIINPAYANYYFSTKYFTNQLSKITKKSVNQASFTVSDLKKLNIPCPDLAKQDYVVDVLYKIVTLIEKCNRQLLLLDELVKSRFIELFGDPTVNPMQWDKSTISKYSTILCGYPFNSQSYTTDGIKICGGLIIYPNKVLWSECKYWKSISGFESYLLEENDIVMAMDRPWISDGFKIAQIKKEDLPALLIQRTAKISAKNINPQYLYYSFIMGRFNKHCNVTGSLVPHISIKDINSFNIMIPPRELQNKFANFIKQIDKSKVKIQNSLAKLETLKKSLMQEYFA